LNKLNKIALILCFGLFNACAQTDIDTDTDPASHPLTTAPDNESIVELMVNESIVEPTVPLDNVLTSAIFEDTQNVDKVKKQKLDLILLALDFTVKNGMIDGSDALKLTILSENFAKGVKK
jgi:hypothetical protein